MNPIVDSIVGVAGKVLDKFIPDAGEREKAKLELAKMDEDMVLAELAAGTSLAQGQMEINKVEAASENLFKSGWRPAVGWIGGFGLAYATIIEPIARFIATVHFHYTGSFPAIDTNLTMQILLGILGLGAMRSWDKKNGKS